ncbi:Fdx2 [Symbiodinium microadriaticum]|nr:Fdx2 [Symbiodinium microadriaticum]
MPVLPVNLTFIEQRTGDKIKVDATPGKSLLDVAIEVDVDIEGACGGEMACSTCHVILPTQIYQKLPPKSMEEDDMLDLAQGVTETSRLGCQVIVTEDMEGMEIVVPDESNNML